jgi:glyoxylase-like metal-dependent hydrolase (beta-lactamase superfamily II)
MHVVAAPLWFAQTNCYVVAAARGEPAVVVDAPPDPVSVARLVEEAGVVPVALLVSHGHVDHVGGARAVAQEYSLTAYLHPDDEWLATDPEGQLRMLLGMAPPGDYAPPERYESLADGQVLELAGFCFEVLHTPGHTPGHCCFSLADEGVLFAGDLLFAGSIGRTDLPGGDFETLMRSMAAKVLPLPAETDVFPGHGPTTTLARELQSNPFLQTFRT